MGWECAGPAKIARSRDLGRTVRGTFTTSVGAKNDGTFVVSAFNVMLNNGLWKTVDNETVMGDNRVQPVGILSSVYVTSPTLHFSLSLSLWLSLSLTLPLSKSQPSQSLYPWRDSHEKIQILGRFYFSWWRPRQNKVFEYSVTIPWYLVGWSVLDL